MKKGFSLIELLISLITISCVVAAFTPVLTRKVINSMFVKSTSDKDKGLQIYATPGTYAFDVPLNVNKIYLSGAGGGGGGAGASSIEKTITHTTNSTFTVPKGVSSITVTITGAGGGGGGGNGTIVTGHPTETLFGNIAEDLSFNSCLSGELTAIRGSYDENDLCWTKAVSTKNIYSKKNNIGLDANDATVAYGEKCKLDSCCWSRNTPTSDINDKYYQLGDACNYDGARYSCVFYNYNGKDIFSPENLYRLPNYAELKKFHIPQWADYWIYQAPNALHLYSVHGSNAGAVNIPGFHSCPGAPGNNNCELYYIWGSDKAVLGYDYSPYASITSYSNSALRVHCVRSLKYYTPYSASGGSSGAQLVRTISVLPGDTLVSTIGSGGAAGVYTTTRDNGTGVNRVGNGGRGSVTTLVHKRGATIVNTYTVKGGVGGLGALSGSHGSSSVDNSSSVCAVNGVSVSCTIPSYSGESGTNVKGGNGGRVANSGTIVNGSSSSGGYLYIDELRAANVRATDKEISLAKGQSATISGFGGGGGLTPAWVSSTSHFFQGGNGGSGKIDLTYSIALPGGGGGAGASAGVLATGDNKEIELSVVGGDRLVVIVGKGGLGGNISMAGSSGSSTIVGENDIVFGYGYGGSIPTNTQISSLQGGSGGSGGSISISSSIKSKIKMDSINNYKGNSGLQGGVGKYYSITNNSTTTTTTPTLSTITPSCPDYGFDGGLGATTYLRYFGMGIGGGSYLKYDTTKGITTTNTSTTSSTSCSANSKDGSSAKSHAPAKNQFGGEGGGGGGINPSSTTLGKGGDGGDGYLRIRWGG